MHLERLACGQFCWFSIEIILQRIGNGNCATAIGVFPIAHDIIAEQGKQLEERLQAVSAVGLRRHLASRISMLRNMGVHLLLFFVSRRPQTHVWSFFGTIIHLAIFAVFEHLYKWGSVSMGHTGAVHAAT